MRPLMMILMAIAGCIVTQAQQKSAGYSGSVEAGLLNGSVETNAFVNTVHGYSRNGWFFGAGAGVDFYRFRSVPVFATLSREFGNGSTRPLVFAAGGINISWPTDMQKNGGDGWWSSNASYTNGVFARAGFGVSFNNNKPVRFQTTASWSLKTLTEKRMETTWGPWPSPDGAETERRSEYRLNRLQLGFAVLF